MKQETLDYRSKVKEFLDGRISAEDFRAYRVTMGIYEQRTAGKYMVRIRIAAGLVLPAQLERIAQLSKTYGNGIVHVTTRQDIQLHYVSIEDTPDILEDLLKVGLSSRGGGGNCVRNITACPMAGLCQDEEFDVAPYSVAVTEYLLQDAGSFNLPRKFKIVFSGCSKDCALASVADIGFFAHTKDAVKGFAVYAAGGLGSNPAVAVKIEDFVETKEIFEVTEAVKRLFDKHGDRTNRHKARLRYVLTRLGVDEFLKLYQQERQTLKSNGLPHPPPQVRDIMSAYQIPADAAIIRLYLKNGEIPADDLNKVGQIAAEYGHGLVKTTQLQDILFAAVDKNNIDKINNELKALSINVSGGTYPKIVTCTGASTCKLGICLSRGLSDAILNRFSQTGFSVDLSDTIIRISGCPNSCANHHIADIGLQGRAKKVNARLMPCYDIFTDGKIFEGGTQLAAKIGTVPAKRIPALLTEALARTNTKEHLKNLIESYSLIDAQSIPDDYYYDFGVVHRDSM